MAYICMIAVCYLGGVQIVEGRLQSGDLISFISYIGQVLSAVMMVAMMMVMLCYEPRQHGKDNRSACGKAFHKR